MGRNLKGSDFSRQVKNSLVRLDRLNTSKHSSSSGVDGGPSRCTFGVKTNDKRNDMIRDFANYISNRYGEEDKLNTHFIDKKIDSFLRDRMSNNQSSITKVNYARSFSSMLQGLRETNVSVAASKDVFDNYVKEVKDHAEEKADRNDYIPLEDRDAILDNLSSRNVGFAYIAELQGLTALRVSEARAIVESPHAYIKNNCLVSISGKGGREYDPIILTNELHSLISKIGQGVSVPYSSYAAALKDLGIKSNFYRTSYCRDRMISNLNRMSYRESLRHISLEINHTRESVTQYYLDNSGF